MSHASEHWKNLEKFLKERGGEKDKKVLSQERKREEENLQKEQEMNTLITGNKEVSKKETNRKRKKDINLEMPGP